MKNKLVGVPLLTMAFTLLVSLIIILFLSEHTWADEVWLRNGDRLTGEVIRMKGNIFVLSTSYAGEISIKWEEVQNLETENSVRVVLSDDTSASGTLLRREAGEVAVRAKAISEPLNIKLSKITMINPEVEPPVKIKARLNIGASYTRGNTDRNDIYGDAELVARTKVNRYTIGGLYNFSEEDNAKTTDNVFGYMKYDHFFTQKMYGYAHATGEKDKFKDLNLRSSLGLGVGYQFVETERTNLSIEGGLSYISEDYILADDNDYTAGRWGLNFDHNFWEDHLQFFHVDQGFISIEDSDDLSIKSQTGFRIPFYKRFNSTIQFNWDWDKTPSPGKEESDKTYLFTVGYFWKNQ
jgi:putative salt-induced outer membrane protein YdiY